MNPVANAPQIALFGVAAAAAVALLGTIAGSAKRSGLAIASHVAAHVIGVVVPVVFLLAIMPALLRILEDFEAELPSVTILCVRASHLLAQYAYLALPGLLIFLAGDIAFYAIMRPRTAVPARIFSGVVTGACMVAILLCTAGAYLPAMKPVVDLS